MWHNNLRPPLPRLRVCAAHADALARMGLGTLKHAKPQQVRFCRGRFAASCYNNLRPPLPRLRVCAAHADALARMGLGTLKHAKPQQVRFCRGRFAASCYNNLRLAAAAAAHRVYNPKHASTTV
ncbi:hypothetical protein DXA32_17805 [Subdoligranulum sp. OF01-18]|nr:hypothetical protein DXA32_17805 [Subdoligranulum sp. OF01-18]